MSIDTDQAQEEKTEEVAVEETPVAENIEETPAEDTAAETKGFKLPDPIKICPICGVEIDKYELGELGEFKYISCKKCGSVMADPRVTKEEIEQFFADVQPKMVHIVNHEKIIENFKKEISKKFPNREGKKFLDLASRQGYSIMAAKELGFASVKGIDPYEFSTEFSQEHYDKDLFEHITVVDYAKRGETADVVLCLSNLCEQPEVEKYIEALSKIVSKGGKVYFEEPDGNSFFLPHRFISWFFLDPPINSIYVSRSGLKNMLKKYGFKITKRFFSWSVMDRFIATKVK